MTTPGWCTRSETISAGGSAETSASSVSRRLPLDWRRCVAWPTGTNPWRCLSSTTTWARCPEWISSRAHEMHPLAKRVLLVERDYSVRSPVVQAMTLGQADYHITKPWMLEKDLYRVISEFLAEWANYQEAGFELFHVIGQLQDRSTNELRELLTRFNMPFHFLAVDSEQGRHLLEIPSDHRSRRWERRQRRRRMRCRHRRSG